jgi:serine/threonine-protein kinase
MAANMADQVGRVLGERYRVLALLGSGASARVYLAEDVALRRPVAVKLLHPSLADDPAFLKRFRAEAQAAAALSHPNIVAVFDWGEEGTPYLVTEALAGGSLRAMLDRGRRLTPSQALLVGLEAARGLDYAHRQGFVHRDIKPANLLFGADGRLRVADFGLARAIAEAAWTEPAGVVLGTARYASPEQARGQAVDGRSDVYSLALVLIEAVTGEVPFAADTTVATLMARLDALLRVPAELGPLAPVIERAGRPDPSERSTASELARALIQTAERLPRPGRLPLATVEPLAARAAADAADAADAEGDGDAGVVVATTRPADRADPDATTIAGSGPASGAGADADAGDATVVAAPRSDDTTIGPPPVVAAGGGRGGPPATLYDQEEAEGRGRDGGRRRRRRWPWVVLVLLLLAGLGAGGWALFLRDSTPTYALPDLTRLTEDQVEADPLFAEAHLKLDAAYTRRDGTIPGQVLDQVPPAGEKVREDDIVHITVSQGQVPRAVPDLTGKSDADARAALMDKGLVVGTVTQQYDEQATPGTVLSWTLAGTEVDPGTSIDLVTSAGPAPRPVPTLVGTTLDQATAALQAVQLGIASTQEFSDTVQAGQIISADHNPGDQVARDTVVNVVVSKGPDLVTVPDVSGLDQAAAVAKLRDAGFVEGDVSGRAGRPVLATEPRAGQSVKRGSTIDIVVG